jgi:uncharacterized protein YgfB (UPF0149 family)
MSEAPSLPSYTALTKELHTFQPNANAAQIHGLLCGYICATSAGEEERWEEMLPGIKQTKKVYELLEEVLEASYCQLNEFSFEFSLILPDEKENINIRAEALGLWCQGFLTGLELANIPIQDREPGEVTEALDDIIEISEISFGDIAENDEDESAYLELVEYVRLSVLMIFHELKPDNAPEITDEDNDQVLH